MIVLIKRDMIHIGQTNARLAQTIGDSLGRKARPMLDPTEALFLGRRNQFAVEQKRRRGIGVKSVEAEDHHCCFRTAIPEPTNLRPKLRAL